MERFQITLVSREPSIREAAAKAFDSAPRHWSLVLSESVPENPAEGGRVVWGTDVEAPDGAPRFDPDDPATLSGLAAPHSEGSSGAKSSVFVVTSVAGGAGVSTVALHLARSFAVLRRRCLLFEAGEHGWLRARLNLPVDARTLQDLDGSDDSFLKSCLPVAGGFKVMLNARTAVTHANGQGDRHPISLCRRAGDPFERIVHDLSAGRSLDGVAASGGLLVLPPTRTALRRAEGFFDTAAGFPWAIICNRVGSGGSLTPALLAKELGRAVDVGLPCTPALRDAEDRSELLPPRYRWIRGVMRVAKALDQL